VIARAGSGWQTVLADLSLILFMLSASALSQAGDGTAERPVSRAPSPRAEPLAVWREAAGSPALGDWLAAQAPDPRAQLTILAPYGPGGQTAALAQATRLAADAARAGVTARVVVEPGAGETTATLAYDDPAATLARTLRSSRGDPLEETLR